MQYPVTPFAEQPLSQVEDIAEVEGEGPKKRERCKNGTRRNKNGECEPISASRKTRCPNGTRKNKVTGNCDPINPGDDASSFSFVSSTEQLQPQMQESTQAQRQPRCPKGTRRNKKTGLCESAQKRSRCPNGTRKNKQTGKCEPIPRITDCP